MGRRSAFRDERGARSQSSDAGADDRGGDAHAYAARMARGARAGRRPERSDQPHRPGVRRSADRRTRHEARLATSARRHGATSTHAACDVGDTARVRPRAAAARAGHCRRAPRTARSRRRCARATRRAQCHRAFIRRVERRNAAARGGALTGITRKPAFWIAYALVAIAALALASRLFPIAIPIVNLDVKMSRADAIAAARALATRLHLAPEG